jgi:hypothetical protein
MLLEPTRHMGAEGHCCSLRIPKQGDDLQANEANLPACALAEEPQNTCQADANPQPQSALAGCLRLRGCTAMLARTGQLL